MPREGGLILTFVVGIAALIIAVIISFIIIQNVAIVEEGLSGTTSHRRTIINESGWLNSTDYTLGEAGYTGFTNPSILTIYNQTENLVVGPTNYTVSDAGVLSNTTDHGPGLFNVSITYAYDYKGTAVATEGMRENFTKGIQNVSNKLPTILLILAVILILGVLVLLWAQYKSMGIDKGSGIGGGRGSGPSL